MDYLANLIFSSSTQGSTEEQYLVGFEAVETAQMSNGTVILINTLPNDKQDCLIDKTLTAAEEERAINDALTKYVPGSPPFQCILYGQNCRDLSPDKKRKQLLELGFGLKEIKIYRGGLFEWLLLQDIYGAQKFRTTKRELDLLRFRL